MANEELITTRNLIDADLGPLRRFTGILDSMPTEKHTYGEGESARETTRVSLNFKEIEVIEAIEPYHFPIYTLQMGLSNRKKSRWGVFGVPLNDILDTQYTAEQLDANNPNYIKPSDRASIKDCIGKRMGLVMADSTPDSPTGRPEAPMLYDGRAGVQADRATPAWTVYMVEGIGVATGQGITSMEKAMQMLDNKTMADFNKAALADPAVRNDPQLLAAISLPVSAPNSFVTAMVNSLQFTKDEQEIYHRVAIAPAPAPAPAA